MKKWYLPLIASLLILACKNKDDKEKENFVSLVSFINGQVKDVDTSVYTILKIDFVDSTAPDTSYVPREEFRTLARDFLELPDVASKKYRNNYREETRYEDQLGRVIITYLPEKAENAVIQRQEMLIAPDDQGGKVKTIIVDYLLNQGDSAVTKRMLWQVDQSFQVTTISQKTGQPENIRTTKVTWGLPDNQ